MIKVLLVDDEQFIRQGLRKLVNWEEYGYQIAAEAENGMEAIRILEQTDISLVFVDIKMPQMTGLELIERVREKLYRQVGFVILTGYADFGYAKKALQMDVLDYLLKPIREEELIRVLEKINEDFRREQKEEQEKYEFHISQVLMGKFSPENIMQVRAQLGESAEWKYVSIEFEKNQSFSALSHGERLKPQNMLRQYLQSLMGKHFFHIVPLIEPEGEVFGAGILLEKTLYEESGCGEREYLDSLQKRLNQHFEYQIQMYVGQPVDSLEQLSKSFGSIRVARCLHGLAQEESCVMKYEDFRHRKSSLGIHETDVEVLLEAVKNNQPSDIETSAELIFSQIRGSDMNMEMVNASIYHILYRLMEMVREFDDETNQQEILEYIGRESFNKLVLSGSSEEITGFFLDYAGYLAQVRSQESKKVLDRVDDYVREHYMEKLSLKSLGELFYVNNVYLGQLYKKKYGIVFREYLNNLRMEKAQELLIHTNMRIYAISEEVGFGKVEYFINKFVQINHMTPNQYRIRYSKGKEEEQ